MMIRITVDSRYLELEKGPINYFELSTCSNDSSYLFLLQLLIVCFVIHLLFYNEELASGKSGLEYGITAVLIVTLFSKDKFVCSKKWFELHDILEILHVRVIASQL